MKDMGIGSWFWLGFIYLSFAYFMYKMVDVSIDRILF